MSAFLEISDLSVAFRPRSLGEWLHRRAGRGLRAVNGLSLSLERGDSLAIIGERGCGKNRLARALLRLTGVAAGDIHFDGQSLKALRGPALMQFRRRVQLLSHDPVASLNPRLSVFETLAEPLQVHRLAGKRDIAQRVDALMAEVGLPADLLRRRPTELRPGECHRLAIARALALGPEVLVANDSLAGLDLSIQAQIINLLAELRHARNLTLIYIAHDPRAARHLCRSAAIMYLGRIVEQGPMDEVLARPRHPYTQALLKSTPKTRFDAPPPVAALSGEPPHASDLVPGCAFHPRCAKVKAACRTGLPPVRRPDGPVTVWCHLYPEGATARR
jgi:oligopeptide transport system ATP-binding protein